MRRSLFIALAMSLLGCGSKPKPAKITAANVFIGDCVEPTTAGALSDKPKWKRADRDLNGDGQKESVYADRNLCRRGNCYWNLFTQDSECHRYIGTVAGASLEVLEAQGDGGFYGLRGWWKLSGGHRQLVQNYQFRSGGYQVGDVLVCRQEGDNRLWCAAEEQESQWQD